MEIFSKYLYDLKFEQKHLQGNPSISATTPLVLDFWETLLTDAKLKINESNQGNFLSDCREKISNMYNLGCNPQIGFSIGASQVYFQAIAALTSKGDTVIIECPTYEPLKAVLNFFDLNVIEVNILDPDLIKNIKLLNAKHKPKVCIFTSPNMPTGKIISAEVIDTLQTLDCPIVVDECYLPAFSNKWSIFDSFKNIVSISNSSKTTGLSSLRVGWYITEINSFKDKFEKIGTLLHVDAPTAPLDIFTNKVIDKIPKFQSYFKNILNQNYKLLLNNPKILNIQAHNSIESGGYFTTLLFDSVNFQNVTKKLSQQNISAQSTEIFGLKNGFRISLNSDSELFTRAILTISDTL